MCAFFNSKTYDSKTDRLFLRYYALPHSILNKNGWKIVKDTIHENIQTFKGKPLVLKRKDPNNPIERDETGNFVHATLGEYASVKDDLRYMENYTVGVINDVSYNEKKDQYAFDVEITDPKAKEVLKDDKYIDKYPPWVSPMIVTYPGMYPEEQRTRTYAHWEGLHLALVDKPAFGFEHHAAAGKCLGKQDDCMIQLRHTASEKDYSTCNFCITDAMKEIIGVSEPRPIESEETHSSQYTQNENSTISKMAASTQGQNIAGNSSTMQINPASGDKTFTLTVPEPKQQINENRQNDQSLESQQGEQKPQDKQLQEKQGEEGQKASLPKTYEEALDHIKGLQSTLSELKDQQAKTNKFIAELQREKRFNTLKTLVPRDAFKSEEKYNETLEKVYNWKGITDEEIKEHFEGVIARIVQKQGASIIQSDTNPYEHMRSTPGEISRQSASSSSSSSKQQIHSSNNNSLEFYHLVKQISGEEEFS